MLTAKFGNKKFEVTPKKIYTPSGLSFGEGLSLEETERSGQKPTTWVKSVKLQTLSFDVKLDARFVTIETELRWWKSTLLSQKAYDFTLGKYKIGKFQLSQYDVKDIVLNKSGVYTKATLSLSFTEYAGTTPLNLRESSDGTSAEDSVSSVKASAKTVSYKDVRKGSIVKSIPGTRRYYSASDASCKKGKTLLAINDAKYRVTSVNYASVGAVAIDTRYGKTTYFLRTEDITVVEY